MSVDETSGGSVSVTRNLSAKGEAWGKGHFYMFERKIIKQCRRRERVCLTVGSIGSYEECARGQLCRCAGKQGAPAAPAGFVSPSAPPLHMAKHFLDK